MQHRAELARRPHRALRQYNSIDGSTANVAVNAKVEGRTDGATGAEWTTLRSSGLAEDQFLDALIVAVTGAAAPGRALPQP